MTVDELRAEIARRRELGLEAVILIVPGARHGLRCRVMPGVMGEVLAHNADGDTITRVLLDDLERALLRATR